MIKVIILAVFLSTCAVREKWVKREVYTCISIEKELRFNEPVWYIRWESSLGGIVYEFAKEKPAFEVGYKVYALII